MSRAGTPSGMHEAPYRLLVPGLCDVLVPRQSVAALSLETVSAILLGAQDGCPSALPTTPTSAPAPGADPGTAEAAGYAAIVFLLRRFAAARDRSASAALVQLASGAESASVAVPPSSATGHLPRASQADPGPPHLPLQHQHLAHASNATGPGEEDAHKRRRTEPAAAAAACCALPTLGAAPAPAATFHALSAEALTVTRGGSDSGYSTRTATPNGGPRFTVGAAAAASNRSTPTSSTDELRCPICKGPGRRARYDDSTHCQTCYNGLYNDARKVITHLTKRNEELCITHNIHVDLERFAEQLKSIVRPCPTKFTCEPEAFASARPVKARCQRCRTLATLQIMPEFSYNTILKVIGSAKRSRERLLKAANGANGGAKPAPRRKRARDEERPKGYRAPSMEKDIRPALGPLNSLHAVGDADCQAIDGTGPDGKQHLAMQRQLLSLLPQLQYPSVFNASNPFAIMPLIGQGMPFNAFPGVSAAPGAGTPPTAPDQFPGQ